MSPIMRTYWHDLFNGHMLVGFVSLKLIRFGAIKMPFQILVTSCPFDVGLAIWL